MKENEEIVTTENVKQELAFKAVIFDMDGTLIESTQADYKAWEKVFNDYGKQLTYEDYLPILGVKSANVIKDHLGYKEEDDVKRILKEKYDYFVDYVNENPIQIVPSADVFLRSVKDHNLKIALATSSRRAKVNMVLDKLDFKQYFDVLVSGDEIENSKPAPDIFLKAAERLGIDPKDCIVVEDGPIGVAAAKNAGMICIAVTATHTADKLHQADFILDTYKGADVIDIFEKCKR